jgi:2-polyprenyl-3-methyl-5-hydroxy-6-metoxy-1,4-benzoquinol methylase
MLSADHSGSDLVQGALDAPRHDDPLTTFDPGQVTRIVTSMRPQGARVRDVGCGTGALAQVLSDASGTGFLGIEPDDRMMDATRLRWFTVGSIKLLLAREWVSPDPVGTSSAILVRL